jgi:hypothetical protein
MGINIIYTAYIRTKLRICLRQMGQSGLVSSSARVHFSQDAMWPHGSNTVSFVASQHIIHSGRGEKEKKNKIKGGQKEKKRKEY